MGDGPADLARSTAEGVGGLGSGMELIGCGFESPEKCTLLIFVNRICVEILVVDVRELELHPSMLKLQKIRRPLQRSSVLDLLDRLPSLGPSSLKETACRHEGCSLLAVGLKVFRYIGTQGPVLKAPGLPTSRD